MAPRILSDLLAGPALARGSLLGFRESGGWTELSGPALTATARELAAALAAYGAEPGSRIAVLSRGGHEAVLGELAVHGCGAVAVPLDGALRDELLLERLRASDARFALVSEPALLERLVVIRPDLTSLDLVLLFRPPEDGRLATATLVEAARRIGASLLSRDPELLERIARTISPENPAYLLSVLEGRRRGLVAVSHATAIRGASALAAALGLGPAERVFVRLPSEEGLAQGAVLACLLSGAAIACGRPDAGLLEDLAEARASLVLAEPVHLEALRLALDRELQRRAGPTGSLVRWAVGQGRRRAERALALGTLPSGMTWAHRLADHLVLRGLRARVLGAAATRIVSIGPPLSAGASVFFLSLGASLHVGFGLAEAGGVLSLSPATAVRAGTAGRPLSGLLVRIGPNGEIELTGPILQPRAPGTSGEGEASSEPWIGTGLRGGLDEQGFLRVEGRMAAA